MKDKNNKKKTLKGMTLIEVIVSLAIVTIMTAVLVGTSSLINSYVRSSKDVNDRVARQAPIAEAKNKDAVNNQATDGIEIVLDGKISLHANTYRVYDDEQMKMYTKEYGSGLNMKFITDIETTTDAPA